MNSSGAKANDKDGEAGAPSGGMGGGGMGGKGSDKEDKDLAKQIGKSMGLSGSGVGGFANGKAGNHALGTGFGGFLDKVFGYDNLGQRRAAYNNNPNAAGRNANPVAMVPSYPFASPGYVVGSVIGAPMSPLGAALAAPGIASAIAQNKPYESMAQKIAEYMGAERGPQVGEAGVGHDLGGKGGNMFNASGYNLPQGYMQGTVTPQPQQTAQPQPTLPMSQQFNQSQYLSPTPGYGVWAPQYSYFSPNSQPSPKAAINKSIVPTLSRPAGIR